MAKVFVVAGQSNAEGRGTLIQLAPVPAWAQTQANGWTGAPAASTDTGIQYPHPTPANSPCLYTSNNTGLLSGNVDAWGAYVNGKPRADGTAADESSFGPETSFVQKYLADHPGVEVAVVKVVLGGSSITDWLTGSMSGVWPDALAKAKARLQAAGKPVEWAGLIWMQGESGASDYWHQFNDVPPGDFLSKTRAFFAQVRQVTRPDLPVVVGRISDTMLSDPIINGCVAADGRYTAQQYRDATAKRRADQDTLGTDPGCVRWSNDGFTPRQDNSNSAYWYHWLDGNYLAAGERAYAAWRLLVGETSPPPPPPLVVRFNGSPVTWTVAKNGQPVGATGDTIDIAG